MELRFFGYIGHFSTLLRSLVMRAQSLFLQLSFIYIEISISIYIYIKVIRCTSFGKMGPKRQNYDREMAYSEKAYDPVSVISK